MICKGTLCGESDKIINRISECRKLATKERKTRHDWLGCKMINWELYKKLYSDHATDYRYTQKSKSVLEIEKLKNSVGICDTNRLSNPARRPDLVIVNEKNLTC